MRLPVPSRSSADVALSPLRQLLQHMPRGDRLVLLEDALMGCVRELRWLSLRGGAEGMRLGRRRASEVTAAAAVTATRFCTHQLMTLTISRYY